MIEKDKKITKHAPLLERYLPSLVAIDSTLPILDLACGDGRNGLFCWQHQLSVVFADINQGLLTQIHQQLPPAKLTTNPLSVAYQAIDFEHADAEVLAQNSVAGMLVFRYLHRPLMAQIKAAVIPKGIVIYETFTTEQPRFGRPTNPDFLLKKGELLSYFSDWDILYSFEGITVSESSGKQQAIAQIVAQKKFDHCITDNRP